MTTWMVRKSGSDNNGGTSRTVRSTGADGISNNTAGLTLVTSITAAWDATDIGHAITLGGRNRIITAVTPQTTKTATTTNASATLQSAAQFDASMVGQAVTGPGIQPNTIITAFTDSSHVTMSIAAGAGFGTGTVTFYVKLTTTGSGNFVAGTAQAWVVGGAWQTISKAVNSTNTGLTAGDSIYIGGGTYREVLSLTTTGSAGNILSYIGDVDGFITGDMGEVICTGFLNGDFAAPSNTQQLQLNTANNLAFSWITFVTAAASSLVNGSGVNTTFTDCQLIQLVNSANVTSWTPTSGIACNLLFDRCVVFGAVGNTLFEIDPTTTVNGNLDLGVTIRNCFLFSAGNGQICNVSIGGSATGKVGGVRLLGCTSIGGTLLTVSTQASRSYPCEVRNCLAFCSLQIYSAGTPFSILEENNIAFGTGVTPSQGFPGRNSSVGDKRLWPQIEFGHVAKITGVSRPFFSPSSAASPMIGFRPRVQGSTPYAFMAGSDVPPGTPGWHPPALHLGTMFDPVDSNPPTPGAVDFFGRPRPSGAQSSLPAVGYAEFHDVMAQDLATFDVGPSSAKLVGAGDQDMLVPVDASTQTLSVRCLVGGAYQAGGPMPTVTMLSNAEIGVTAQIVSAQPGLAGQWQTLTFAAITPTAAGYVRLRFTSYDGGVGQVNFDTFAVA